MKIKSKYLNKLKIPIYTDSTIPYIKFLELEAALIKNKIDVKEFDRLFGCQTMGAGGPYYYDVEAVLVRMIENKLTGTQLIMD